MRADGCHQQRHRLPLRVMLTMRTPLLNQGHCWADCLANPSSGACTASCGVENDILDTNRRVKVLNPGVSTVLYWNTLLAFPFYTGTLLLRLHLKTNQR